MMMTGNGVAVTSWGWADDDGVACRAVAATHRIWKVRVHDEHAGFLALPLSVDAGGALAAAVHGLARP